MTLNLIVTLRASALAHPERIAISADEARSSYAQLLEQAQRFAGGLARLGVPSSAKVALLLPNSPWFVVAYFGALNAGCTVVPLNCLLTAAEIAHCLEDSDCRVLVAAAALLEPALEAARRVPTCAVVVAADAPGTVQPGVCDLAALLTESVERREPAPTSADETAVILYTSGTTGRPKGAELTHFSLFFNAVHAGAALFPPRPGTVPISLAALPLFHSFGQTVVQNMTLVQGGTIVLMRRFDAGQALEAMHAHRVTVFAGVPTMYLALLQHPEAGRYDLSRLQWCISGGSAMPAEVMKAFDARYGVNVLEGYGLSETSPIASFNMVDRPKKIGSIGRPIWGVDFKLVDERGEDVTERGGPGEICIRGHNVMKGYHGDPASVAELAVDGWFRTGDIARRDEDGYFFIVDRKKDMMIRGGYNVYPREVEEVLYGHPAVAEAAVVGVRHPSHGEEIKAFIVLKPAASASADELQGYCRERLAAFKYPRIFEFCAALPKGPTGKVLKRALRA